MALFPKTPGVYVQEISSLPPSVVPVPTAIPVFVGYTQQAIIDGQAWIFSNGPTNPIRIESMLEYQSIFGGANNETFSVSLTTSNVNISISSTTGTGKDFRMFYNIQMYFANGGGPCYIISTGIYSATTITAPSSLVLANAISKAEQVDEITLVLVPDSMSKVFTSNPLFTENKTINDAMLTHCAKMQSRFALIDVKTDSSQTIALDAKDFRDNAIGANNLSYGACYYPSFSPSFGFTYLDNQVTINATDPSLPSNVQAFGSTNTLNVINNGIKAVATVTVTNQAGGGTLTIGTFPGITVPSGTSINDAAINLANAINSNAAVGAVVVATPPPTGGIVTLTAISPGSASNFAFTYAGGTSLSPATGALSGGIAPDKNLYNRITTAIVSLPIELYPSSMMAGVYATVDNNRGVWKAPANVGVSQVSVLNRNITDADQSGLNVDPASGKSIDAIRTFEGRGMLVWGARTLDGNSNDFRYVNVRRTLIFIEHSCKLASEFVVFEPNDKNTWIRVKGMIGNFLNNLWRDGGLVGDKPEQAYFVKIGLGETMTAQDILEGKLIVTIGVAISHPAEFVILNFMHKLQEA